MDTLLAIASGIAALAAPVGAVAAAVAAAIAAWHGYQNGRAIAANHAELMSRQSSD